MYHHLLYRDGRNLFVFVLPPMLTTIALWLPFGFSLGGLVEEWGLVALFSQHGIVYIADSTSALAAHRIRPLNFLPHAFAYALDRDSFYYWHVLQAASLIVKGICGSVIGFYITRSYYLAVSLGLLLLLCPVDTMQLSFRSLGINWSVALMLMSTAFMLWALQCGSFKKRVFISAAATASYCAAVLMYEAVILMIGLPLLIVFAREGAGGVLSSIRKRKDVFACWLVGFIGCVFYLLWTVTHGATYQGEVVGGLNLSLLYKVASRWWWLGVGAYRAFFEAWLETGKIVVLHLSSFFYPVLFTAGAVVFLFAAIKWAGPSRIIYEQRSLGLRTIVAGLLGFVLGYSPYLTSLPHLLVTQRTFLMPAVGIALVILGGIVLLESVLVPRICAVISASLIGLCFVGQLYQFDKYNRTYAEVVRPILSAVIPFMSVAGPNHTAVLVSNFGYLSGVWDFGLYLQSAVTYIFKDERKIILCEATSGRLLPRSEGGADGSVGKRGRCEISEGAVSIAVGGAKQVPVNLPIVGRLNAAGVVAVESLERPSPHELPSRLIRLVGLGSWTPSDSMFKRGEKVGTYECIFESEWGYGHPCRTFGIFPGQVFPRSFFSSFAWVGETAAGLFFNIEPGLGAYLLRIDIWNSQSKAIGLVLNGVSLKEEWKKPDRIEAGIPVGLWRSGLNTLELKTQLDPISGLSIAIQRIAIDRIERRSD